MANQDIDVQPLENAFVRQWIAACVWSWEVGLLAGAGTVALLFQWFRAVGFGSDSGFWVVLALIITPISSGVMWAIGGITMGLSQRSVLRRHSSWAGGSITVTFPQRSVLRCYRPWAEHWAGVSTAGAMMAATLITGVMMFTPLLSSISCFLFLPVAGAIAGVAFGEAQRLIFHPGNQQPRWLRLHAFGVALVAIVQVLVTVMIEPTVEAILALMILAGLASAAAKVYGGFSGGMIAGLISGSNARPG